MAALAGQKLALGATTRPSAAALKAKSHSKAVAKSTSRTVVSCSASNSRRELLFWGAAAAPLLSASTAGALIPDDEDEELLAELKARRYQKIEAEKVRSKQYVQEEGLNTKQRQQAIVSLQFTISTLYTAGGLLEQGSLNEVSALVSRGLLKHLLHFVPAYR